MNAGSWSGVEHQSFVRGLERYGKNWRLVASLVKTRSLPQIRSYAQKHFLKFGDEILHAHQVQAVPAGKAGIATQRWALGSLSAKVKGAEVCTFAGSSFVVYHTACCGRSACGEEHRWTVHKRFSEWKTLRRATKADSEGVCFPKQMEGRIRGLASGRPDMAIAGKRASRLDDFVQHLLRAPLSLSDGSVQAVCAFLCADRDVHAAASDRDVHAAASSSDGAARATHGSERSTAASIACNLRCVRRAEGV
jgi:SHAQKYF class myb-like DNA-binding protein